MTNLNKLRKVNSSNARNENKARGSGKKFLILFLLFTFFISISAINPHETHSVKQIINNMFLSVSKIKTLKFKLKKKERIESELSLGEQEVKFNRLPKMAYTKIMAPNSGVEVLYVEGQNSNKALVNPNGFPYVTLTLDPYGNSMRKNNHHTLHEIGFDYVNSIISYIAKKSEAQFDKYFIYKGDTVFNNRPCYKILIDYIPYAYVNYTVKQGENITKIAYNQFISDYMVLQLNKKLDDYDDVEAGDVIKIPNAYARKTVLFIDKENYLPLVQMMYDENGLYASYEFYNVQVNPSIAGEEFSKNFKGYRFK